jgi:hypothetical protein
MTVAWEVPADPGCAPPYRYRVERDTGTGFYWMGNVRAPQQTYMDSDVQAGNLYVYRILAANTALEETGPPSAHASAYAANVSGSPTNLHVLATSRTTVTVAWTAPGENGNSSVSLYHVSVDDGMGGALRRGAVVTGTEATLRGLIAGRSYRVAVHAENAVGYSAPTPTLSIFVAALAGAPVEVSTFSVDSSHVGIRWDQPVDDGGSLILGYRVEIAAGCVAYDAPTDPMSLEAVVKCDADQPLMVSVRARTIAGWGNASMPFYRACAMEPGAPQLLSLYTDVPERDVDSSDVRSPTSMTLTWMQPGNDGGDAINAFRLYRDNGTASGVYALVYEGEQTRFEAAALVPGRVYRFVVSAVNNVGEGNATSAFAAKMHCTPRTLAGSPTKVTGSDTRIVITWPETTNNCGASVNSYRIYRNSDLLFPISNSFTSDPQFGRVTADTVEVTFEVANAGAVWLGIFSSGAPSIARLKEGLGWGRAPCRRMGVAVVPGSNTFSLFGCHLESGWQYSYELHAYVEGMNGMEDDGSLAPALPLPTISSSNRLVQDMEVVSMNKMNITISFQAAEESGRYWAMLASPENEPAVDVPGIKALINAEGDGLCKMQAITMNSEKQTIQFESCKLRGNKEYYFFLYIEDGADAFDGSASFMKVVIPPSNDFLVAPALAATPSLTELQVEFTPTNGPILCRAWVLVVEEHLRPHINTETVKTPLKKWIAGGKRCVVQNMICDDIRQVYVLDECEFDPGTRYYAFVYVEDNRAKEDGTVGEPMEIYIPPRFVSNTFSAYPVAKWDVAAASLSVGFSPREDGTAWIIVVPAASVQCVQMGYVKAPADLGDLVVGGDACRATSARVMATNESITLPCVLPGDAEYAAFVYLEDGYDGDDGDLGSPAFFSVPKSATIASVEVQGLVTPRKITVAIDSTPGLLAVLVVTESSEPFAGPAAVVDAVFAVGAASCRMDPTNVTGGELILELSDCSLKRGGRYAVVAYTEGPKKGSVNSADLVLDGQRMSTFFDVPQESNTVEVLRNRGTPTEDGIAVVLDTDLPGFAWVYIVPGRSATNPGKTLTGAVGAGSCMADGIQITENRTEMDFTGCSLDKRVETYSIVAYVEDDADADDGSVTTWTFEVPFEDTANSFYSLPMASDVSGNGLTVTFASNLFGVAWGSVVEDGTETPDSFPPPPGRINCTFENMTARPEELVTVELHNCSLFAKVGYRVEVYVEDFRMGGNGTYVQTVDVVHVPESNEVSELFLLDVPTVDAVSVSFVVDKPGFAYVFVQPQAHVRDALGFLELVGDVPTAVDSKNFTYAMGLPTCKQRIPVNPNAQHMVIADLTGCSLKSKAEYAVVVYAEGEDEFFDGHTIALPFAVPISNSFLRPPTVVEGSLTPELVKLAVQSSASGSVWVAVSAERFATAPTAAEMKAPAWKVGGGACFIGGDAIALDTTQPQQLSLSDCAFTRGYTYTAYIYIEDNALPHGDGIVGEPVELEVPVANAFAALPLLTGAASDSVVPFAFTAEAPSGRVWVQVVPPDADWAILPNGDYNLSYVADKMKSSHYEVGGCDAYADVSISDVALADSLTGCDIEFGEYHLAVYVEDDLGLNDGAVAFVPFSVQEGLTNSFVAYPIVTGATEDEVSLEFTASAPKGLAYVMVTDPRSPASMDTMKVGQFSVGGHSCKIQRLTIDASRTNIRLSDCGFTPEYTYFLQVYVERWGASLSDSMNDGELAAPVPFSIARGAQAASARLFVDDTVEPGGRYVYQVRAVNSIGVGEASMGSETLTAAAPPAAPGRPTVPATSPTSIRLAWAPPADYGALITGYKVFMNGGDGGDVFVEMYFGSDSAYTQTGLTTGLEYVFYVVAVNSAGAGLPSEKISQVSCVAPSVPASFRVQSRTEQSVTIAWDPPFSDGGCPVTGYVPTVDDIDYPSSFSYSFTWSAPDQDLHYFEVRTVTTGGQSSKTTPLDIMAALAPDPMLPPLVLDQSAGNVTLGWSTLTDVSGYRVFVNNGLGGVEYTPAMSASRHEDELIIDSGLVAGRQYCFKVAALNNVTENNPHQDQQPQTSDATCTYSANVPFPPAAFYFERNVPGRISPTWPASGDDQGAQVQFYEVSYNDGNAWITLCTTSYTDLRCTLDGCTTGTQYEFRIRAQNAVGWGPYFEEIALCALPPDPPVAPRHKNSTRTSLDMQAIEPEDNGAPVIGYRFYRATATGSFSLIYDGSKDHFNSIGLATGQIYRFYVVALNEAGPSEPSPITSIPCAAIPDPVADVKFATNSRSSTVISWTPPLDDGGSPIIRYEVYYRQGGSSVEVLAWTGSGTQTDTIYVTVGASYEMQISVVNLVSQATASGGTRSEKIMYYGAKPPDPPLVRFLDSTTASITLGWDLPLDDGGIAPDRYIVLIDDGMGGPFEQIYDGPAMAATATGLATGYTYRFTVTAASPAGEGDPSPVFLAMPCDLPSAPLNFHTTSRSRTAIEFTWDPPLLTGSCPLLGYAVKAAANTVGEEECDNLNYTTVGTTASPVDFTFKFVVSDPGATYCVKALALNFKSMQDAHDGGDSDILYVMAAGAPAAPTSLYWSDSTATSMTLCWDEVADDGGAPITGYVLERNDGLGGDNFTNVIGAGRWSTGPCCCATAENLVTGNYYAFRAAAVSWVVTDNSLTDVVPNYSPYAFLFAAAPPDAPPAPRLVAGSRTRTGCTVEWDAPISTGGIPLTGFILYRNEGVGTSVTTILWNGVSQPNVRQMQVSGLTPGVKYKFEVVAATGVGTSERSSSLTVTAGEAPNVGNPIPVSITTSISFKWQYPDDDGGSAVTAYRLVWDTPNLGEFVNEAVLDANTYTYTTPSLEEGQFYRFILYAENAVGWSSASNVYRVQICAPPEPPSEFVISEYTDSSIALAWSPPDNVGCYSGVSCGCYVESYALSLKLGSSSEYVEVYRGGPATLAYIRTGLATGNIYDFKITTSNFMWTSQTSAEQTSVYVGAVPAAPPPPKFVSADATSVVIEWEPPYSALQIEGYELIWDNGEGGGGTITGVIYQGLLTTFPNAGNDYPAPLVAGKIYRFQVVARNANGEGVRSPIAEFVTASAPNPPDFLRYVSSTINSITVEWDAPVANDGAVVRYELVWSDASMNSVSNTIVTVPSIRTATPAQALELGHTYRFNVRACSINECGAFSSAIDLLCGDLPDPPAKPYWIASDGGQITIGWDFSGRNNGGVVLQKYNVKVSTDGATYALASSTSHASIFQYSYDCVPRSTVYFKLAAVNGVGGPSGEGSDSPAVGFFCANAPAKPDTPIVSSTASSIDVGLPIPTEGQLDGAEHLGWRIYLDDADDADGDTFVEAEVFDPTLLSYTFTSGIVTGHRYRVKTKLCSVVSCSVASNLADPIPAASPAAAPLQPYAVATTNGQIKFAWIFEGSNGGSPITEWWIYHSTDGLTYPTLDDPSYTQTDGTTMEWTVDCTDVAKFGEDMSKKYLYFKVSGKSAAGVGVPSPALAWRCSAPPRKPDPPTKLAASVDFITMQWTAPSVADTYSALSTGFILHVDDGQAGPFTQIYITDITQTTFTLTGVMGGQRYRWRLQTVSETGESVYSDTYTIAAASPAAAPVQLEGRSDSKVIEIYWQFSGNSGGTALVEWNVYVSADGIFDPDADPEGVVTGDTMNFELSCVFQGQNKFEQYLFFQVAAVTAVGPGTRSNTFRFRCSPRPNKPEPPVYMASTSSSISVAFAHNGLYGAELLGYRFFLDDGNNGPFQTFEVVDASQAIFTASGLDAGLTYRWKLQVISESGESDESDIVMIVAAGTPDAPNTPTSPESTLESVTLGWEYPGSDGGSAITFFYIYVSTDGMTWPAPEAFTYRTDSGADLQYPVPCRNLDQKLGDDYTTRYLWFKVAAVNAGGKNIGRLSNGLRFRCSPAPDAPPPVVRVSGTQSSITVQYQRTNLYKAIHTGFVLLIDDGMGGAFEEIVIYDTTQLQFTFTGLNVGYGYRVKCRVRSEVGDSPESNPAVIVAAALPDPPDAPVYYSSRENAFLTVTWAYTGNSGGSAIIGWDIQGSSSATTWPQGFNEVELTAITFEISCDDFGAAGQFVYARVRAVTSAGAGDWSGISRLFCSNKPLAPGSSDNSYFREVTASGSTATVEWKEDDLFGAELMGYRIYMDNGNGGDIQYLAQIKDTSQRYYTVAGLLPARRYRFRMSVISAVSEGELTDALEVWSCGLPSTPNPPSRLDSGLQNIEVAWVPPPDNGCPITGYRVFMDRTQDGVAEEEAYPGAGDIEDALDNNLDATVFSFNKGGLDQGQLFGFQLRVYNTKGYRDSAWSYLKSAGTPAEVTGLVQFSQYATVTSIALGWDVPNMRGGTAIGFKVYRNNGGSTAISDIADPTCGSDQRPAPQRCAITGLIPGESYMMQIVAVNDIGEGTRSQIYSFRAAVEPSRITNVVHYSSTALSITFAWAAPSSNGAAIFGYTGEVVGVTGVTGTFEWRRGTQQAPNVDLQITFTPDDNQNFFASNFQYKFRVRAVNELGDGAWSSYTSIDLAPRGYMLGVPVVPTGFGRALSVTPSKGIIHVSSLELSEEEAGGDDPANLRYEFYGGQAAATTLLASDFSGRDFSVDAYPHGSTWVFKARVTNNAGMYSEWTPEIALVSAGKPDAPSNVNGTSENGGEVVLEWDPPDDGGAYITSYECRRSQPDITAWERSPNYRSSCTLVGQNSGAVNDYQVRAWNSVGASEIVTVTNIEVA